jgi:hypothetical protein
MRPSIALACLAVAACIGCTCATAGASVSLPVTWDALVRGSTAAAVVTPVGGGTARAIWEDGRICTYTRVHVDRAVAGPLSANDETWVRTLGGVVGKVGQVVDGEAVFVPGRSSLVFLMPVTPGSFTTFDVTARGQGQFPVLPGSDAAHPPIVVRSHTLGTLVPRAPSPSGAEPALAADELHGRTLDDAVHVVTTAWAATHATP